MATPPLLVQLAHAQNNSLYIGLSTLDLFREAQGNLCVFTTCNAEAGTLQLQDIVQALHNVTETREQQLIEQYGSKHPMVFYCWVDAQAGQLRFSLVSAFHQKLPFGCTIKTVERLADIVEAFLRYPYHDGIPLAEFEWPLSTDLPQILAADVAVATDFVLDIWTARLPRVQ